MIISKEFTGSNLKKIKKISEIKNLKLQNLSIDDDWSILSEAKN